MRHRLKRAALSAFDVGAAVLAYPAGLLLRGIRTLGVERLPACRRALARVGVFPLRDHYYEPQFNFSATQAGLSAVRPLTGIDWNVPAQLQLLAQLRYAHELAHWQDPVRAERRFNLHNDLFGSGDAEFWYQLIRHKKPRRIIEIGSGHSTLIAREAIQRNAQDDAAYACEHVCIEPYEAAFLDQLPVTVVREQVEHVDVAFFTTLERDDILFIDSSHVIRPHGDVLFEYLTLLPALRSGVIVHVHDIFSPRNYPAAWLVDRVRFWNEQYLLEAFLTHNQSWTIIAALNLLHHDHFEALRAVAPFLARDREPGSFYMQKR